MCDNSRGRSEWGGKERKGETAMATELELLEHKALMRKLAGQKAARTRARRAKKVEYPNPLSTAIVIHGREYIPYRNSRS